jgi:hypothetical protein
MKGFHVERRFGWDTHGLPIEHEIDKKLGVTGKAAVMKIGLENYNAECRAIVMRFREEWRHTVERLGRWIDFDNDYKVGSRLGWYGKVWTGDSDRGRQWIPRLWNPSGGCSSNCSTRARCIRATV